MKLRAFSLHQPWAALVAAGIKHVETRSRPAPRTIIGCRVAIHAAKTDKWLRYFERYGYCYQHLWPAAQQAFEQVGCHRGAIIATAIVEASIPAECLNPDPFGDYAAGRHGWMLADIRPLAEPIPWKGSQGIFFVEMPNAKITGA